MSGLANHGDEISEDGSTGYSDFCDDDAIRAADQYGPSQDHIAMECPSSATLGPSSASLGKRKSPEDSVPSDRPSASYKRRTISGPIDLDGSPARAPLSGSPSCSWATRPSHASPPLAPPGDVLSQEYHHDDGSGPYIIAHNTSVQRAMDARGLPWGVQWEIARQVSLRNCSWEDISMSALDYLKTKGLAPLESHSDSVPPAPGVLNARVAPYLEDYLRWNKDNFGSQKPSKEILATSPWRELDKEDLAFKEHGPTGCLGCTPELKGFYGGKVSFSIKAEVDKQGKFKFTLEHPVLGPSSRFKRCYGSSWQIKLRLSKDILSKLDMLKRLLIRPLVLNGQIYRFFHVNKDHHVDLMATNELYNGLLLQPSPLNGQYCSFLNFFKEHNNLEHNSNQTIAKWASRTALGLSTSIPGVLLEASQIREEVDIVSSSCPPGVKHPSEMDMTDGCGLINLHALHMLHENIGLWKEVPMAVQCRLAGAKGLWLLHPGKEENSWEYPCVWLRPSQLKIQNTPIYLQSSAHRIIDTLRASHMQSSVKVSKEMIVNLSENGVLSTIFLDLFSQSIEETILPLLNWDGPHAMAQLWAAIAKQGNVMASRIARESAWTARAYGIQPPNQDDSSENYEDDDTHSLAWWGDDISGCPSSLEETVMAFLDTGFHPATNPILAEKLHHVANKAIKTCTSRLKLTVPMSCSALIVPDVLGVLQEGEIHVKCSQRCLLRSDGQRSDRIIGDILVTRSPCKLPTDVQKVKAVFRPELDDYVNVIMFSIKGSRSLASMLGTGDYDGDRVVCIWQPSIVEPFQNADAKYLNPPTGLWDHFDVKNETVQEFLQRVPSTSPIEHQTQELQTILMTPLKDPYVVGTYSNMHDNAVYSLGYSHPTTTLLAWIFCTVLDGAKTGKTILQGRYRQDCNSKQYGTQFMPPWKMEPDHHILQYPLSRGDLPPFVMDLFRETMESIKNEYLQRIADHFVALPAKIKDADLVAPWQGAEARAQEMLSSPEPHVRAVGQAQNNALEAIKTHVARVSELYADTMRKAAVVGAAAGGGAAFTQLSIESRQDKLRAVSREFVGGPPGERKTFVVFGQEEVARLRASYAYLYDWTHKPGGTRFPWSVAMRELGAIKLRARNDFKPISQDFYENMSMRKL